MAHRGPPCAQRPRAVPLGSGQRGVPVAGLFSAGSRLRAVTRDADAQRCLDPHTEFTSRGASRATPELRGTDVAAPQSHQRAGGQSKRCASGPGAAGRSERGQEAPRPAVTRSSAEVTGGDNRGPGPECTASRRGGPRLTCSLRIRRPEKFSNLASKLKSLLEMTGKPDEIVLSIGKQNCNQANMICSWSGRADASRDTGKCI